LAALKRRDHLQFRESKQKLVAFHLMGSAENGEESNCETCREEDDGKEDPLEEEVTSSKVSPNAAGASSLGGVFVCAPL
jgi:hypothetical protein